MSSYKPYPAYKDSEVGWIGDIPSEWNLKKTKYLFRIAKRIAGELGHDVLSITQRGIKVKDVESGGGQLAMDYAKYQLVYEGDFAMNHMDLLTGYVDISKYDGVISPDYRVFQLRDKGCDPQFFLYLYQKAYWDKLFYPLGQGSSQLGRWRFPSDEFNLFQWPLPPKSEQTAIAQFLDHKTAEIKAFIELKEKTIALLKERKTAIINHAVNKGLDPNVEMKDSGIEWLGEIPKHWGWTNLRRYALVFSGGTPSRDNPSFWVNGTIPWLASGEVNKRRIYNAEVFISESALRHSSANWIPKESIVIALAGQGKTKGMVATIENEMTGNQSLAAVVLNKRKLFYTWLAYYIEAKYIRIRGMVGELRDGLNLGHIKSIPIPLLPIKEQHEIVKYLDSSLEEIDMAISQAEKEIALIKEYQQSLISEAVTGKIDVREEVEI